MSNEIKCLNRWDVESKHILDVSGISETIYAGECRYGGGEKYVLYETKDMMGFDVYNMASTGNVSKTLNSIRSDSDHTPVVCYGISAYNSNCMKSSNPHSGIYEAKTSRTLDLNGGNPACNQGGMMVVIALEGNGSRPSHAGNGWSENNAMYTLNTIEQHAICYGIDLISESRGKFETYRSGVSVTEPVKASDYKGSQVVCYDHVLAFKERAGKPGGGQRDLDWRK